MADLSTRYRVVDTINDSLVVQGEDHTNIHRGVFFSSSDNEPILGDDTQEWMIRVTDSAHLRMTVSVAVDMLFDFYGGATIAATGTSMPVANRNTFSSNTASTTCFVGPTVTDDGTPLLRVYIPAGGKQTAAGNYESFMEWVLSPGDYLIRVSNNIIAPASAGRAGVILNFYEPV